MKMEIDRLARVEIDLPDPHVLVLEDDPLPDFTERDAFFPGRFQSRLVGHAGHRYLGSTAMALISIR